MSDPPSFFFIQGTAAGVCPLFYIRHILALHGPQLWSTQLFLDVELFKMRMTGDFTVTFPMPVTSVAHNLVPVRDFLV